MMAHNASLAATALRPNMNIATPALLSLHTDGENWLRKLMHAKHQLAVAIVLPCRVPLRRQTNDLLFAIHKYDS